MYESKKRIGASQFHKVPDEVTFPFSPVENIQVSDKLPYKLMKYVDDNIIGKNQTFPGPFGKRKIVYCDYTASGRALNFIEDYILKEVLPTYGNTHTTTTHTAFQSTMFREEARNVIRNAVRASEDDVVLFVGHGCTGALHKLIHSLDLSKPPIVFVGPWEPHSNLLPWKEIGSKIIRISENREGILDLNELENQLKMHQDPGDDVRLIGCFSAASNITGNLADDVATTLLLHQYGALSFWDYATAAPYVGLDMNPFMPGICETNANKDALFFSGHKFVGGVQSPGILVAKKSLFKKAVPEIIGGGAVFFVSREDHLYFKDPEVREEGGTAAIVESVRVGLAVQLKQSIGPSAIMCREEEIVKMVTSHIRTIPEIILLGSSLPTVKSLAVFSLMVRHPRGMFLHHNFVCAILNDMFGIQARGGCACAGPYAQDLLGIDKELAEEYEKILLEDSQLDRHHLRREGEYSSYEILRPGFTRISLPYFMSEPEIAFVLEALKMVATEGWKLLPQYIINPDTGEWYHQSNIASRECKWLTSISYCDGEMSIFEKKSPYSGVCPSDFNECLRIARNYFNKARKIAQKNPLADQNNLFKPELHFLRWFMLPSEAQDLLLGHYQNVKQDVPFNPSSYSSNLRQSFISPQSNLNNPLIQRQRSDSHSSTQNRLDSINQIVTRERCHSLGSAVLNDLVASKISKSALEQVSSSFKCTLNNSCTNTSVYGFQGDVSPQTYLPSNTPELLQAYVKDVTNELATEIKSELRGVIAKVDDALSESCYDNEQVDCVSPISSDQSLLSQNALPKPNITSSNKLANRNSDIHEYGEADLSPHLSEYLAGLTAEVVSEVKTELREAINVTEDFVTANADLNIKSLDYKTSVCKDLSVNKLKNLSAVSKEIKFKKELIVNSCDNNNKKNSANYKKYQNWNTLKKDNNNVCNVAGSKSKTICDLIDCKDKQRKHSWKCPPKKIWKPTSQAIQEFDMLKDGDRVLVCLSGGKDSLSLLHTLNQYQHYSASKGIKFELAAVTVDPKSSVYNPRPLIPYLQSLGIKHFYEEQAILDQAEKIDCKSVCSFCSRMKRGRLYATARKHGYNVLAMGQHLDDVAESFFMSTFHNGRLRSMKAHYYVREQDLRIIRPFIFVRERNLRKFAESNNLPVIPENCPACFSAPKERNRMKQLLAQQEIMFPKLFVSIKSAIKPLISFRFTEQENTAFRRPLSSVQSSDFEED